LGLFVPISGLTHSPHPKARIVIGPNELILAATH
jgi:hypothetical protein